MLHAQLDLARESRTRTLPLSSLELVMDKRMKTKKLLVAFDESKPDGGAGDFLAVVYEQGTPHLLGLRTNRFWRSGRMVYIGKEITANDLLAKLINTGRNIESVERALSVLEDYVQQLQDFRIGNLLGMEPDVSTGFRLVKLADSPPVTNVSKLP